MCTQYTYIHINSILDISRYIFHQIQLETGEQGKWGLAWSLNIPTGTGTVLGGGGGPGGPGTGAAVPAGGKAQTRHDFHSRFLIKCVLLLSFFVYLKLLLHVFFKIQHSQMNFLMRQILQDWCQVTFHLLFSACYTSDWTSRRHWFRSWRWKESIQTTRFEK